MSPLFLPFRRLGVPLGVARLVPDPSGSSGLFSPKSPLQPGSPHCSHGALEARLPLQSSLALFSRVAWDFFRYSGAWGSPMSRTPRNAHEARKSRRTHESRGGLGTQPVQEANGCWSQWKCWTETGPQAGRSGCRLVQQGLGGGGGRPGGPRGPGGTGGPLSPGYPQLWPDQSSLGGPADLVDLSSPLGPHCRGLPWGQWAQEAPEHQLHHLKGTEEASGFLWLPAALEGLHPRSCPGQLGSPKAGQGPQGGSWGRGPARSVTVSPASLASSTFSRSFSSDTLLQLRKPEKPVGPKGQPPGGAARPPGRHETRGACNFLAARRRGPGGCVFTGRRAPSCTSPWRRSYPHPVAVTQSYPTPATPWTVARQAPLSMGFSRQEYWSGLPFPSPGAGSSQPRDQIRVCCIASLLFINWATRKTPVAVGHLMRRADSLEKTCFKTSDFCVLCFFLLTVCISPAQAIICLKDKKAGWRKPEYRI